VFGFSVIIYLAEYDTQREYKIYLEEAIRDSADWMLGVQHTETSRGILLHGTQAKIFLQ
jgi:hypothetical protein